MEDKISSEFINSIQKSNNIITKEEAAELLKTTPGALESFEKSYRLASIQKEETSRNFFDKGKKFLDCNNKKSDIIQYDSKELDSIIDRIVEELIQYPNPVENPVTLEEVESLPDNVRPMLTGNLVKKDMNAESYPVVLFWYNEYLKEEDPETDIGSYCKFLQGLDILDIDPITYEILGMNPSTFSKWYPQLKAAVDKQNFFKIPKTVYKKIPLPILQLSRIGYETINKTTKDIVNRYVFKTFNLDENKKYFIKTGTFSYKFDFRNCKVEGEEVKELGEYLLYIQSYASQMASPLTRPTIVGVSTTNEWVVREYIEDIENNPTIYKGLPLHTEYRFFIDCDTDEILGKTPYWDKHGLLKNFDDDKDPDKIHDYIITKSHLGVLEGRYYENIDKVTKEVENLLPDIDLKGQWSLDIMQNGNDFYIIDMALAAESALADCIPEEERVKARMNWIQKLEPQNI